MPAYDPRFVCPECGRVPVDKGFDQMVPAMQRANLKAWDTYLAKTGGVLSQGQYECINGHQWRVSAVQPPAV